VIERLRAAVRVEDLLLAAWLIVVEPLLAPADPAGSSGPSVLEGVLGLAGLIGLAVCIGARSAPGVISGLTAGGEVAWTIGPLIGAFALVVDETREDLALGDAGPVIAVVLVVIAVLARWRGPVLDARQRRALVTPFILVAGGAFGEFLSGLRDLFDLRDLFASLDAGGLDVGLAVFVVGLALLGVIVFYVMLIYAPRQVAEREGSPGSWAFRFVVFVVSLVIGTTLAGVIRG
jgi:hypothetical protein